MRTADTNRHTALQIACILLALCAVLCCAGPDALAVGTPAGTVIANQATVTYDDEQGNQQAPIYANTLTFTVGQIAAINLSPATATKSAPLGSVVDYATRITNSGNGQDYFTLSTTSSIDLTRTIYHDLNSNGVLDDAELAAGEIFAVGLAADGQISIITRLQVPENLDLNGKSDLLTVRSTSVFDTTKSATGKYTTRIESPRLAAAKSVDNPTPAAGARVVYTVAIGNEGHATAAEVRVVDLLNPNLRYVSGSASPAPTTVSGQTLSWDIGSIEAGASRSISFAVEVAAGLSQGAEIHNSVDVAYLDGASPLAVTSIESSFITVSASGAGSLTIGPERLGSGEPGDTIDHALTVVSNGAVAERFDLRFESTRGIVWQFHEDRDSNGVIDAGEPVVTATPMIGSGGRYHVVARGTLPVVDTNRVIDSTTFRAISQINPTNLAFTTGRTEIRIPVMTLVKTTAQPVQRSGGEIRYTISYSNSGSGSAFEFQVVDSIPASTAYVPGSILVNSIARTEALDDDGVDLTDGVLTVSLGTIPPASSGSIEFRVLID